MDDGAEDSVASDPGYSYERAMSYALWLLGRRDYPKRELRERLEKKGTAPHDVERVMARLDDLDLVDDARYAAALVRVKRRKKGIFAIRQELRRKGIGEALTERALAPLTDESQLAAATRVLTRQAWRFEAGDERARARAYAFLARRGFPSDVAGEALRASGLFDEP